MKFMKLIWIILAWVALWTITIEAADIPPSPPARLAGYVFFNGQLLKDSNGYSLRVEIGKIGIEGKIDSQGGYALLIPNHIGVRTGDPIEISLCHNERSVSSGNIVNVPDFGTMKIVHLNY